MATTRLRRRAEAGVAGAARRSALGGVGRLRLRSIHRPPAPDRSQPDRDREPDRDRRERAPSAGCDRRPPRGEDQQSGRQPDAERLTGGRAGIEEPDEPRDPDAEQQTDRAEQQSLADRQPDLPIGEGDPELRKHPPDYTVGRRRPTATRKSGDAKHLRLAVGGDLHPRFSRRRTTSQPPTNGHDRTIRAGAFKA